jgi:CheY-like chemotaxis protein
LIVDDSDSMRLLIRLTLEMDPSLEIVGEATDGLGGVTRAEELSPDLVVMDLSMPVMDGIEATRRIIQKQPDVRIVAFTSAGEGAIVEKALAAGASTKVDKEDLVGLMHALQELAAKRDEVFVGAHAIGTARTLWTDVRVSLAAAAASIGSFTRDLGRAEMAGAVGIGGVAAMALVMFMVVLPPSDRDPVTVRPGVVLESDGSGPEVGSIELKRGELDIRSLKDDGADREARTGSDGSVPLTGPSEVADVAAGTSFESVPTSSGNHSKGAPGSAGTGRAADNRPSVAVVGDRGGRPAAGDDVPPGLAKRNGPPGHAKKHVPPGLAKRNGPPGHAKKHVPWGHSKAKKHGSPGSAKKKRGPSKADH